MRSLSEYLMEANNLMESDKLKKHKGHEYVDLGLPSGTLWATENITDTNGNELYFAWGETTGYTAKQVRQSIKEFNWDDYKFGVSNELTKYGESDNLTVLKPEDDAATQNWGTGWRMPTKAQFEELLKGTNQEWTNVNGIKGLLCTSRKNSNTLFLPTVGYARGGEVIDVDRCGCCWSVSLHGMGVRSAWYFSFDDGGRAMYNISRDSRYYGFSVRPVRG